MTETAVIWVIATIISMTLGSTIGMIIMHVVDWFEWRNHSNKIKKQEMPLSKEIPPKLNIWR